MSVKKNLAYYIHCFTNLRRDYSFGGAPHKPILLLSLIENVEQGLIVDEKIFITPDLVASFKSNWSNFVITKHTMKFAMPFFYMKSEPFWKLIPKSGYDLIVKAKYSLESFANLNSAIEYALLDKELFFCLSQRESREVLRLSILNKYFPYNKSQAHAGKDYISEITSDILTEKPATYKEKLEKMQEKLEVDTYNEEVFIRGNVFKRVVPKIYNNTCCISGLNISATFTLSMVDACHIVPFSESHDDTITNGLALSPNMHRAFDRGLITINENYIVIVSERFTEESVSPFSIKQFKGKQILLPSDKHFYPSAQNLIWHQKVKFNQ
ncbi:MAG: HNH endonuclease [Bacteroidota bacterium]